MKKVLALTAGALVALAPTGTAFAGESVPVPGNAYGNCKHSSSGGNPHTQLLPGTRPGVGNGGLVTLGKTGTCAVESTAPTADPATTEPALTDPATTEPATTEPAPTTPAEEVEDPQFVDIGSR